MPVDHFFPFHTAQKPECAVLPTYSFPYHVVSNANQEILENVPVDRQILYRDFFLGAASGEVKTKSSLYKIK